MNKSFGEIIGRRIRTRQSDDASASCSGSSQLDPPSVSSACTAPSAIPSTFNATSSPNPHCGSSAPKLLQSGKMPSQRHEPMACLAFRCMPDGVAVTKPGEVVLGSRHYYHTGPDPTARAACICLCYLDGMHSTRRFTGVKLKRHAKRLKPL